MKAIIAAASLGATFGLRGHGDSGSIRFSATIVPTASMAVDLHQIAPGMYVIDIDTSGMNGAQSTGFLVIDDNRELAGKTLIATWTEHGAEMVSPSRDVLVLNMDREGREALARKD